MKAQSFMPDYVASILVFAVTIGIFISSWNGIISNQNVFELEDELRLQSARTATFLVSTPGYPDNWEEPGVEVQVPGFASSNLLMDTDKIKKFGSLSYDAQRSLLKARDFNLTFWNNSGIIEANGEKLSYGDSFNNADTIVPVTRSVRVNTSNGIKNAEMKLVLWR